jgi:hypothetical protein
MYTMQQESGQQSAPQSAPGARPSLPQTANSLLVADCGTVMTKVSLFGLVEGQYRLMARGEAPTTVAPPQHDITAGILQAIETIEFITGRHFIANGQLMLPEQEDGNGADIFIATVSVGGPLRMVVLGGVSPTLETLAQQAVSGLYVELKVMPTASYLAATANAAMTMPGTPGAPGMRNPWPPERIAAERDQQIARIRELRPHAALIVGMADGPAGPVPLQDACQLLLDASKGLLEQPEKPLYSVLYAGAPQYTEAVRRMISSIADITRIEPLTSQAQLGPISVAAAALHERDVIQHLPGYQQIVNWSAAAPVATTTSLSSLVRFLAQHYSMNVTAVDVGGMTTTLMVAGEHGEFIPSVNSGVGIGSGISGILQRAGVQRIVRWLPFSISEDEVRQFVLNRIMHPHVAPANPRELQLCQAFAREAMALALENARHNSSEWIDADLILATGGVLSHAPKEGQLALMLLDALQPRGVVSLVVDSTMLITQLGAVATVAPIPAVQVNENDAVTRRLGTCVVPFGAMRPGVPAVRLEIEYSNGQQQQVEVKGGTIEVIPLPPNTQASLSLFPAPGVDVGLGPGEHARAADEIDGGLIGLIVDARGRPLELPTDTAQRQARLQQWAQVLKA